LRRDQELQRERELLREQLHLIFTQLHWRRWLTPLDYLENVRKSSLEVAFSTDKGEYGSIRDSVEESLLLEMPRLTELTTSKIRVFPEHLQKLCLRGSGIPDSLSPINLPSLVSLEIRADGLQRLSIVSYIRVPRLRDLRVQVQDGPGGLHEYDWCDITSNQLDHISLKIGIGFQEQDNNLVFHLPRTHSLNISSPYTPLRLYLTDPIPLPYTLHADIGTLSGSSYGKSGMTSTPWQENLTTVWIHPHHRIPTIAKFVRLVSLRRIVLDQGKHKMSKQSPTDELFKLLAENFHICPQLTSIAVAQCPSCWPSFLSQLHRRNWQAILYKTTRCIEELSFYYPLHPTITSWLTGAMEAKLLKVTERPPARKGDPWPIRPFVEGNRLFRSCYICHITGMELGCLEYQTQSVDCCRERGDGSKIRAL
jgi:hypothetical protein